MIIPAHNPSSRLHHPTGGQKKKAGEKRVKMTCRRNIRIIMMASAAYTVVSFTKAPRCTSSFVHFPTNAGMDVRRNLCRQQGGRRGPERRSVCLPDLKARSAAGTSGNDEKHAALVEWTEKQGAFISPKLALGFDAQGRKGGSFHGLRCSCDAKS